ncbi:ion channel [Pontibacter vulgaris]|uniref:ion channel n=1 Tax=Pontibacter vulgaris TaxID=2905679 RepID=UPI001FA7468F|nr:ion channel [Pontibacter vulgaris]
MTPLPRKQLFHVKTAYKFLLIVVFGILIFLAARLEVSNAGVVEAVLFLYSTFKSYLYFKQLFNRVKETANSEFHYLEIFKFIALNTLLFIISYAIDYICLYEIDSSSFAGISQQGMFVSRLITFFYFSVATFSTAGYGDITPSSTTAQLLTSAEMLLAWGLTILVVANFSHIRESIKNS